MTGCPGRKHDYSEYSHGRCTCELGRAAKAAYMSGRRRTATRLRRTGWIAPLAKHGTRAGYEEHGCACTPCRRAHLDSRPPSWTGP